MATDTQPTTAVVRLSELADGQEAVTFATLVKKDRGQTKKGETFIKCFFRDKAVTVEAPLWADSRWLKQAEGWADGVAYRLFVRATVHHRYGVQLTLLDVRPASDELDGPDGYRFYDLVESSDQDPEELYRKILERVEACVDDPKLKLLVKTVLADNADLFKKMPAAANFHHGYTGGLIEHVWSMTRVASFVAEHYAKYYHKLDPPLNKGVVVAASVLHDIGKLRELDYHPVEAKYTTEGCLVGHVLMGRDMVREAARKIEGFDEETLMLLEHAILAHHGRKEYGAPVIPQTLEALLVSFIDDLDAKMNMAAKHRLDCRTDGDFTDRVFALDNRRFYKGVPTSPAAPGDDPS